MINSFYEIVIRKDHRFATTEVCKDMALLEPGTRAAVEALLAEAKASNVDLRVLETYRSQARQHVLYERRLTELAHVGVHGYGLAVDLALYEHGTYVSDGLKYGVVWSLFRKHKMVTGDDWGQPSKPHSFRDFDHGQRIPLFRQDALFAGTWYPPADYDPYKDGAEMPRTDLIA